jgi:hypothetical protein
MIYFSPIMRLADWIDGLRCVNLNTISLLLRRRSDLQDYALHCAKKYDELSDKGLARRSPIPPPANELLITLPAAHSGGGMSFSEMVVLARATRVLRPSAVFEIGTFNGLTTAIFILNSEPATKVFTMDLPVDSKTTQGYLPSDQCLVANRELGSVPRALGLSRYTQITCDSMLFDPSEFRHSMDLCLIDGAHDFDHVENDTIKIGSMVLDEGIVFWHDYGGRGSMRPVTKYLNSLGSQGEIFRVPDTSLAWARGGELKRALERRKTSGKKP